MKVKDYKELIVWQKGLEIVNKIYSAAESFPSNELYGLATQMQKAAVSIPSNIAEGFMRNHTKEYIQFLHVSSGSCAELETQVHIGLKRNYIPKDIAEDLFRDINSELRMLSKIIKKLRTFLNDQQLVTRH